MHSSGKPGTSREQAARALMHAAITARKDRTEAVSAFALAVKSAGEAGARDLEGESELGWGEVLFTMDEVWLEGLPHLLRAARLGAGSITEASAWLTLGRVYERANRVNATIEAYRNAVRLFALLDDVAGEFSAQQALACYLQTVGRTEEALPELVEAADLAVRNDDPAGAAHLLLTVGELQTTLQKYVAAITTFSVAAELFRLLDDHRREEDCRTRLQTIHAGQASDATDRLQGAGVFEACSTHTRGAVHAALAHSLDGDAGSSS